MSYDEPIYPLENHCSVIHKNTLYVYSPKGFQSLELATGAEWKKLPMDVSLTGAECVLAPASGDNNADMMFIVGGRVNDTAKSWDYPGLMHYTFGTKKWDWQRSTDWVTKERTNHAAIYIPGTKQILVYSGSSDPQSTGLSSESFLIDTKKPYSVIGQPSGANPPLVKPMLMQWDENHALMVGGGASNTAIYTFGAMRDGSGGLEGWRDLGIALPQAITSQETSKCTLISGTDGSKVLETFDLSVAPNKVTRTVLLNKDGSVAPQGMTVGGKTKRFTIDDFPEYNATLAPKIVRSGYSLAHGDEDKIVMAGGSAQEPISIFDAQENSWLNATELFTGRQLQSVLIPTSSSASSSSPTSTPTATEAPASSSSAAVTPPAGASVNNKDRMLTVLGATLGAIFGIAALLILLLLCLRWRKSKKRRTAQGGYVEKDRLSFADRGADFMKEAGGSIGQPKFGEVNGSQTSLAIIAGRAGNGHKRGMLSDASTSGLVKKASPLGYAEPMELSKFDLKPEPMEDHMVRQNSGRRPPQAAAINRSRSSGWSRYFANNDATNLAAMPADRSTFVSDRTSTESQSMYNDSRIYSQPPKPIPPLDIPKFENQRISKVTTGSPTLGNSTDNLPGQPMQAELARANSGASTRSGISAHDHYLRDPVESWSPVTHDERPPSSTYTGSVATDNYRDGASSYYPDNTSSFYPKSGFSSFYPGQPMPPQPDVRESTNTIFPAGNLANLKPTQNSNLDSFYPPPPTLGTAPVGRESTATVFPPSYPQAGSSNPPQANNLDTYYPAPPKLGEAPAGRESTVTVFPGGSTSNGRKEGGQDMSWLNLGVGK